jgi:hypothetical protein
MSALLRAGALLGQLLPTGSSSPSSGSSSSSNWPLDLYRSAASADLHHPLSLMPFLQLMGMLPGSEAQGAQNVMRFLPLMPDALAAAAAVPWRRWTDLQRSGQQYAHIVNWVNSPAAGEH